MKENEVIIKRQKYNTRFKNSDMDFTFNWAVGVSQIIGMAPSQIFYALHDVKDGDPRGWREGLSSQAGLLKGQAKILLANEQQVAAGQAYLGAAYAYRAAVQYTSPKSSEFMDWVHEMERVFQEGVKLLGVPMCPIEVPYAGKSLAGYYLEQDDQARPVVVMIGGGDTFREDLFYFAGYPGWKRGYNVLMVDLPGQGLMPARGLPIQVDMAAPIQAALDWLEMHAAAKSEKIAIYGVSGGGYFTAQAVAVEKRIKAWIAATPIYDIGLVFKREVGAAMQAPGWAVNTAMRLASSVNESAAINLDKYAWQFGMPDFKSATDAVLNQGKVVDYTGIQCPSLILVSEGEAAELQRQAQVVAQNLVDRGVPVTLRDFTAEEGADCHCQLNNLRLAHMVIFDWLDRVFEHDPGDVRLRV
ncbi:MAG TPA: alpha/beta hydrolase [Anaerolineaceae bacterium]|nr:alpha/beta hydrolase [Anaerolineaceae bacterium]